VSADAKSSGSAPYDRARALKNLEDSEDLLREIAGIFVADYRTELAAMRQAFDTGDKDTMFRLAHTLKTSMASFCAQTAFEAAAVLVRQVREDRIDAGQLALVEALTEELATALRAELA
jgi:HPt (histidine-containing phosphotransfer) domain-containing protein